MNKRRFGRSGHESTLAVFGAVALGKLDQRDADRLMRRVISSGINHIDVAPSYGAAELRLGPWMPRIREDVFLGCKTMERSKAGATEEFHRSLKRLQIERFDLFQMHVVTSMEELDAITASGGALEGVIEMRDQGLTDYIGITGHGYDTPAVFIEALSRFDFDSVLFPLNPTLFANQNYRKHSLALLDLCDQKDVGIMIIKTAAKQPWGEQERRFHTWYEPFEQTQPIQDGVDFALTYPNTHLCTPGDYRLFDTFVAACENFNEITPKALEALIKDRADLAPIF